MLKKFIISIILIIVILLFYIYIFPYYLNRYESEIHDILLYNKIQSVEKSHPEWLEKPLKEFYISTSHNTYISLYQNAYLSSYKNIREALLMGARCIELDVHLLNNELKVTHGNKYIFTVTTLDLDKCFDIINEYGFNTSDPLILYLEMYIDDNANKEKLKKLIYDKFKNRLLDPSYKMNAANRKYITNEKLKNLLNKLIIVLSTPTEGFEEITDDNGALIRNVEEKGTVHTNPDYNMSRIYPNPSIYQNFSMNFDPDIYWDKYKANLVCLNFQIKDKSLYKNITKFKNNSLIPIN